MNISYILGYSYFQNHWSSKYQAQLTYFVIYKMQIYTCIEKRNIHGESSSHPWTKHRKYQKLLKQRHLAKRAYLRGRNDANKELLRIANVNVFALYNKLKDIYYKKIIAEANLSGNDSRKFNE